jgi:hypothetical protein
LGMKTAVEADFVKRGDGGVDLKAGYKSGEKTVKWKRFTANSRGFVSLGEAAGKESWAVAYGYAEVESVHPRECVLKVGSNDGIKIWLNGKVVHEHEVVRGYTANEDATTVRLEAGVNRIIVKVDHTKYSWGFGVAVPRANF